MRRALPTALLFTAGLVAQPGAAFDPAEVLRVVVYDDATQKPVAGAQVLYQHRDDRIQAITAFPEEWRRLAPDLELRLERFGRSTTTDANGIAYLPRVGLSDDVAVRTETLYAQTWGKKLALLDELRAGLVVNPSLAVRVLDAAGKPCPDVEVWMQRGRDFAAAGQCFSGGRTGADGTRVVSRVRTFALGESLRVLLKLPGLDVEPVPIDPTEAALKPVTFVLPASVPLRVRVTDAAGATTGEPATVRVRAAGEPEWRALELELRAGSRGEAVVPYVSADRPLRIELRAPVERRMAEVSPLAAALTERAVSVPLVAQGPVLAGRALDEHGKPLADRRIEAIETHVDPVRGVERSALATRTDADGRFRIHLRRIPACTQFRAICLRSEVPGAVARVAPFTLGAAETSLGDLRFALEPLVASGRVAATVMVLERGPCRPGITVQAKRGGKWEDWELDNLVWLDDKSFEIRGRLAGTDELRLQTEVLEIRGEYARCLLGGNKLVHTPFRLGQKGLVIGD